MNEVNNEWNQTVEDDRERWNRIILEIERERERESE